MDAQQLTYLFVFLSFSLYIGICHLVAGADPPMNFMSLGVAFTRLLTAWLQQRIG